jgi:hypothetical protein
MIQSLLNRCSNPQTPSIACNTQLFASIQFQSPFLVAPCDSLEFRLLFRMLFGIACLLVTESPPILAKSSPFYARRAKTVTYGKHHSC